MMRSVWKDLEQQMKEPVPDETRAFQEEPVRPDVTDVGGGVRGPQVHQAWAIPDAHRRRRR
jgi:hypothetical protein